MKVANIAQSALIQRQISLTNQRLTEAEFQVSSGFKSLTFSGLKADARRLLDFESSIDSLNTYVSSIDQAERRAEVMQQAFGRLTDIAGDVRADWFSSQPYAELDPVVRSNMQIKSEEGISELIRVLNVNFENRYLFSGFDVETAPFSDDVNGIITSVDALLPATPYTANALEAAISGYCGLVPATDAVTGSASFYFGGTNGPVSARIDDGVDLQYGVRADDQAVRVMMKGYLMMRYSMQQFTGGNFANNTEALAAFDEGRATLESGMDMLGQVVGTLGIRQQTLEQVRIEHEETLDILEREASEVRDADSFEAITEFQRLQIQLQASFQVTSQVNQLSLVNFL